MIDKRQSRYKSPAWIKTSSSIVPYDGTLSLILRSLERTSLWSIIISSSNGNNSGSTEWSVCKRPMIKKID